jgi:glycosyltransferase involved in cell wall biosynthesis
MPRAFMPPERRRLAVILNARVYRVGGQYFGDLPNLLDLLLELRRQVDGFALCVPVLNAEAPPRWTSGLPPELEIVPLPAYRDNVDLIRHCYRLIPDLARTILPRLRNWNAVGGVAPSGFGLLCVIAALLRGRRAFLLVRGNVLLSLWGEHRGSLLRRIAVTGALLPFEALSRLLVRTGVQTFTFGAALAARYRGPNVHVLSGYARPSVAGSCAPPPLADPDALRQLLYVGRLTGEKGPDVLLRAFGQLRARGLDVSLTVVGDGAARENLNSLATELEIGAHVRFIRYIREGEHLREQYLEAGIVVIPSRTEGVPGVLLEAMALGRVIVASAVGGMPGVVAPGQSGVLVPPNDPRALADAIAGMIEDPPAAFRLAGRALLAGRERTVEQEAGLILRHVFGTASGPPELAPEISESR